MRGSLLCSEGTFFFFLVLLWNEGPSASKPNIENTALFIWRISVGPSFQNHYFIPSKLRDMHSENTLVITSVCLRTVNRKSMDLRQKCNDGEVYLSAKPPSHSPASRFSPSLFLAFALGGLTVVFLSLPTFWLSTQAQLWYRLHCCPSRLPSPFWKYRWWSIRWLSFF